MMKLILIIAAIISLASCNRPNVIDISQEEEINIKENLINANKYIAQSEETQIEHYISRRGWKMERLSCGARVMETHQGNGALIDYEDSISVRCRIEALNGGVIYEELEESFVVGRHQTTVGLDAAVKKLRKGSKAIAIVPSEAAYGVGGDGDRINTRVVLIYHIEIL